MDQVQAYHILKTLRTIRNIAWALLAVALVSLLFFRECHADSWTRNQKLTEISWQVLHIIDWGQTRNIAQNPQYEEIGLPRFIIGSHPSTQGVDLYMGLTAIGHYLISDWLIDRKSRWYPWWQAVSIGATGACVVNNFSIGLRCKF